MSGLTETVDRILTQHCTDPVRLAAEQGVWPDALWQAVEAAGLLLALVDTGEASLGVSVQDAFDIVRIAGAHAAPIPLPETMLGNWLLARASMTPLDGPVVLVSEAGRNVPWGRRASLVHAIAEGHLMAIRRLRPGEARVSEVHNIAREPRDTVAVLVKRAADSTTTIREADLRAAAAALRTAQMAGAIEAATRLTVAYVKTRVQFGKPLGKFQAIQQQVAVLAEQAALARAAADMAADAFPRLADASAITAIAAAKTVVGEAANVTANIAHQMHGAIGFSQAYTLQHLTRRLWSWRDDDGNEAEWSSHLGGHLMSRGPDQVWAEITAL
jgi:acyl-CoA dehydrogenase